MIRLKDITNRHGRAAERVADLVRKRCLEHAAIDRPRHRRRLAGGNVDQVSAKFLESPGDFHAVVAIDTLQAMRVDYIIVRHSQSGVPNLIARHSKASVLNAGDGYHAHPTQALLDAYTLREVIPESTGKKVLIVGDLLHSRVARSTSEILEKLDVQVGVLGPGPLIPRTRPDYLKTFCSFDDALAWKPDVIYLLRIQLERQEAQFFPSLREYHRYFGVTSERLKRIAADGIFIMHPGPVNRGVELVDEVMNYERCLINQQVENGVATRMAVLYWLKPETGTGGAA